MKHGHTEELPSLERVARLGLSAGRLLLESGASGRVVHEAIQDIAYALGCDAVEVMCQHAGVLVMLRRRSESCTQIIKVGEHGVNLRRAQAVRHVIRELAAGKLDCHYAQVEIDQLPSHTPAYPVWLICLSTGLACSAFGRLLGSDWQSFLPILFASAWGQWIRMILIHDRHNVFVTTTIVSFLAALMAGVGARLFGSAHVAVATVASVLMLVPGVAVVNAQTDVLEGRPNLAVARALRVVYLLLFLALGLALAQALLTTFIMNPGLLHIIHQAFFGGIAAVGFAVLFNCRPPMLPFGFASGVLALASRTLLQDHGFTLPTASFFAALLVAVIDHLWKNNPSPRGSLLAFVGSIPMIPGGAAAKVIIGLFTVLRAGHAEDVAGLADIWKNLITLIFTLAAIGTALALPSLFRPDSQRKRQSVDD